MKESKFKKALKSYDVEKSYKTDEALDFIIAQPKRNFKESIDISVRLGIDPKNQTKM